MKTCVEFEIFFFSIYPGLILNLVQGVNEKLLGPSLFEELFFAKNHYGWWHIMSFFNLQYNWNFICNCVSGRYWAKPFPGFWWTLFTNQCQRNIHTQLGRYRYLFFITHQYVWVPVDYLTLLASEYFNSTKVSTMYFLICWGYLVVIFLFYYQRPY